MAGVDDASATRDALALAAEQQQLMARQQAELHTQVRELEQYTSQLQQYVQSLEAAKAQAADKIGAMEEAQARHDALVADLRAQFKRDQEKHSSLSAALLKLQRSAKEEMEAHHKAMSELDETWRRRRDEEVQRISDQAQREASMLRVRAEAAEQGLASLQLETKEMQKELHKVVRGPSWGEELVVDGVRPGSVRPEYVRLQSQLRLLEDVALRLLEPAQAGDLQSMLNNADTRTRRHVPQNDSLTHCLQLDTDRLSEVVDALLAVASGGQRLKSLSRSASREAPSPSSRPSSRQGLGRQPRLPTSPSDHAAAFSGWTTRAQERSCKRISGFSPSKDASRPASRELLSLKSFSADWKAGERPRLAATDIIDMLAPPADAGDEAVAVFEEEDLLPGSRRQSASGSMCGSAGRVSEQQSLRASRVGSARPSAAMSPSPVPDEPEPVVDAFPPERPGTACDSLQGRIDSTRTSTPEESVKLRVGRKPRTPQSGSLLPPVGSQGVLAPLAPLTRLAAAQVADSAAVGAEMLSAEIFSIKSCGTRLERPRSQPSLARPIARGSTAHRGQGACTTQPESPLSMEAGQEDRPATTQPVTRTARREKTVSEDAQSLPPPRSFWAVDKAAAAFAASEPELARKLEEAVQCAVDALATNGASALDELSDSLLELKSTLGDRHPPLASAIRAVGLRRGGDGKPVLVAPLRTDVAQLLAQLLGLLSPHSLSMEFGAEALSMGSGAEEAEQALVAAFRSDADPEKVQAAQAAVKYRRMEEEVAQLKRTIASGSWAAAPADTPFAKMAGVIARREEQLQQARLHIRTQRARTEDELRRLQRQLEQYQPSDGVRATLERMHHQSMRTKQAVEYRAECLRQERARLLELAMSAFCKVGYSVAESSNSATSHLPTCGHFHTLLHGEYGAADVNTTESLAKIVPQVTAPPLTSGRASPRSPKEGKATTSADDGSFESDDAHTNDEGARSSEGAEVLVYSPEPDR